MAGRGDENCPHKQRKVKEVTSSIPKDQRERKNVFIPSSNLETNFAAIQADYHVVTVPSELQQTNK